MTTTLKPNPDYVRELQAMVKQSPYPAHLDFALTAIDFDHCLVEMRVDPDKHYQPFQIVHGGVLATLIDTATFWAGFMRLPADAGLVNVDLKLNYLKAVAGGHLIAEGRCLRAGRQISYTEAYVRDDKGDLVAHGTSTLMVLPGKGLSIAHSKLITA